MVKKTGALALPDSIRIGYLDYKISAMSNATSEKEGIDGDCSSKTQTIRVRVEDQSPPEVVNTLLHEVIHAVLEEMCVDVKNEEKIVKPLTNGLCQVLRSNPEFASTLVDGLK